MMKKILSCACAILLFAIACQNQNGNQSGQTGDMGGGVKKDELLTKITINGYAPSDGIKESMDFGRTHEGRVKVDVEASFKDAVITYTPALDNGYWNLNLEEENELTISVKVPNKDQPVIYKAKITHKVKGNFGKAVDKTLVDFLLIEGLNTNLRAQEVDLNDTKDILNGEDKVITLLGPIATIRLGHSDPDEKTQYTPKLTKVTLNSKDMKIEATPNVQLQFILDVELPKKGILDVEIKAEAENGKSTEIVFKIKRKDGTVDFPGIQMYIEDDAVIENSLPLEPFVSGDKNGKFARFDAEEPAKIIIGVLEQDILEAIEIEGNKETPQKKSLTLRINDQDVQKDFYSIEKSITGVAPNTKDVEIKLIPKDQDTYSPTTLKFSLAYKDPKKNANFATKDGSILWEEKIEWNGDGSDNLSDDYGAKTVDITLFTEAATTKVYYKRVLVLVNEDSQGKEQIKEEKDLDAQGIELTYTLDSQATEKRRRFKHTASKIQLYTDKPTILKFYTVSQDGTMDAKKGSKTFSYNPIRLKWDYVKQDTGEGFAEPAYDEIIVDKKNAEDKKIFVTFKIYDEASGYKVDNSKIKTPHQKAFTDIQQLDVAKWVCSEIDVSTLIDDNNVTELDVALPILKKNKATEKFTEECFTYNVKVKLKK